MILAISDFRKIHHKALEGLFQQVLRLALEAGAIKLGRVALDGTKVKANASKPKENAQYNFSDPESRIMKGSDGFVMEAPA